MLKKAVVILLALLFAVPALAFEPPQKPERDSTIEVLQFPSSEDLIYQAYCDLVVWTLENGIYSRSGDGARMRYLRLTEVLQAPIQPVEMQGIPFGKPKMRKLYFQVILNPPKEIPKSKTDFDLTVRIVIVETTKDNDVLETYYFVAEDKTLTGYPNSVKEWTAYKNLKGKVLRRTETKAPDVPKSAEIFDITWGKWLAEFIKLHQMHLKEDFTKWWSSTPKLRKVYLKELIYENQKSFYSSSTNPNPAAQSDLWPE